MVPSYSFPIALFEVCFYTINALAVGSALKRRDGRVLGAWNN